jgi:hypothetical protein
MQQVVMDFKDGARNLYVIVDATSPRMRGHDL